MTPILLFAYNRLDHLKATIAALIQNKECKESDLIIFCDGPKNDLDKALNEKVQWYCKSISGFKSVVVRASKVNRGLANSVISGVSEIFEKYEKVIVLEDDILTSSDFLTFMNTGLEIYSKDRKVSSISGYGFNPSIPKDYDEDVFLTARASSWGWATWKDRWQSVDWELKDYDSFISSKEQLEKFKDGGDDLLPMIVKYQRGIIDSWAIRWTYHHFKTKSYCLVPVKSKVQNIGTDGSGTNFTSKMQKYEVEFGKSNFRFPQRIEKDDRIFRSIRNFYRPSLFKKVLNYLKFKIW